MLTPLKSDLMCRFSTLNIDPANISTFFIKESLRPDQSSNFDQQWEKSTVEMLAGSILDVEQMTHGVDFHRGQSLMLNRTK